MVPTYKIYELTVYVQANDHQVSHGELQCNFQRHMQEDELGNSGMSAWGSGLMLGADRDSGVRGPGRSRLAVHDRPEWPIGLRTWWRSTPAMLAWPASRRRVMASSRRVAMTRGAGRR
jgi:hypothetical protein